jgi:hypothetical protein
MYIKQPADSSVFLVVVFVVPAFSMMKVQLLVVIAVLAVDVYWQGTGWAPVRPDSLFSMIMMMMFT